LARNIPSNEITK